MTHFDRVEWRSLGDAATAVAALLKGEVDWVELPSADQLPLLSGNPRVMTEIREASGSIPIMRFNQLHPPFNNPAIRRALLGAIDQAEVMNAVAGTDRTNWRDGIGLFSPSAPWVNEAGILVFVEWMSNGAPLAERLRGRDPRRSSARNRSGQRDVA